MVAGRTYQRLTVPLSTTWEHLTFSDVINAKCFHLFETPDDAKAQCTNILRARENIASRPLFIWEPQGKSCNAGHLERHVEAAKLVNVFSPNNAELDSLFETDIGLAFVRERIQAEAKYFVDAGIGHDRKGCIVVRCAHYGCLVASKDIEPIWLPAFYNPDSSKVVDATGAGNAFLGGLGMGYQKTGNFIEAAKYGNVAASFVVEQVGVPKVEGEGNDEIWNGESVMKRLAEYEARLSCSIADISSPTRLV